MAYVDRDFTRNGERVHVRLDLGYVGLGTILYEEAGMVWVELDAPDPVHAHGARGAYRPGNLSAA